MSVSLNLFMLKLYDDYFSATIISNKYAVILTFIVISVLLSTLMVVMPYLFTGRSFVDVEKNSEYECGFEPFDSATRQPFTIHFYIVGILFLVFDVEMALLFPWSVILQNGAWYSYWLMLFFLFLLVIGFLYEWKIGAITWNTNNSLALNRNIAWVGTFLVVPPEMPEQVDNFIPIQWLPNVLTSYRPHKFTRTMKRVIVRDWDTWYPFSFWLEISWTEVGWAVFWFLIAVSAWAMFTLCAYRLLGIAIYFYLVAFDRVPDWWECTERPFWLERNVFWFTTFWRLTNVNSRPTEYFWVSGNRRFDRLLFLLATFFSIQICWFLLAFWDWFFHFQDLCEFVINHPAFFDKWIDPPTPPAETLPFLYCIPGFILIVYLVIWLLATLIYLADDLL
jgi:NADH-quinone oxidoreductase subunit A